MPCAAESVCDRLFAYLFEQILDILLGGLGAKASDKQDTVLFVCALYLGRGVRDSNSQAETTAGI
jgi:hypothetical protein